MSAILEEVLIYYLSRKINLRIKLENISLQFLERVIVCEIAWSIATQLLEKY